MHSKWFRATKTSIYKAPVQNHIHGGQKGYCQQTINMLNDKNAQSLAWKINHLQSIVVYLIKFDDSVNTLIALAYWFNEEFIASVCVFR